MEGLTINEAAETSGWSPRMLRYLERVGLIEPARTASGYRIFGPGELQRLRTLRELLARFDCGLSDVAFAKRMREEAGLERRVESWFEEEPERPPRSTPDDWLSWEQEKHERLLPPPRPRRTMEAATADEDRGLQSRRHLARRLRPQGDPARRARDARPDEDARGVRRAAAAEGRAHHGLAPHDRPDRRPDRDAHRARRRGALGAAATSSRRRTTPPRRSRGRRAGLRVEGRDARGVLVVHRAGAPLARRRRAEHDPRRRRRRHAARPQGRRVREGRRRAGSRRRPTPRSCR